MVLVGRSPALDKLKLRIPFEDLGPEGFALKTAGRHLVIAGGRLRGSMYGVYSFLEKLGCRWFTADVSRIPKLRTITVAALDETRKPAFEYREPFFAEASGADWAARNKANGSIQKLDAARGGKVQYYPFVHSFNALVSPALYFKEHPEYFSLIDGARRRERSQLCLTNPDVLRVGIESVERWIAGHPEASIISVSQNDWTGWCECDNCRRVEEEEGGTHHGPLLRYVNALAAEIEKKHPDKLIDTLAYWYTEDPPSKVRPRKNVRIRLCPIGACEAHPYEQCKYNAYFMKNLRAWSKITNQLYIWHYNTNFSHYLLPFPDFDELAADIPMYKRQGVVGLFMEGDTSPAGGGENAELRSYVMAKLLWDTGTDVNQAIDEFHEAYYGKAAKPMRAYFDLMHNQVRMPPNGLGNHLWIYDRPSAPYLTDDFLAKATELFRQSEAAAETDAVRSRVRKARLSIDYINLMRSKKFFVEGESFRPADLEGLKERWNSFVATVRGFGMTHISESSPLTQDEQNFSTFVRPYRVASMENERLRVHVVPELGGRVTHIIDKRSGRNLLLDPEPGGKQYPNLGGLTVAAYPDYVVVRRVRREMGTGSGRRGQYDLAHRNHAERPEDAPHASARRRIPAYRDGSRERVRGSRPGGAAIALGGGSRQSGNGVRRLPQAGRRPDTTGTDPGRQAAHRERDLQRRRPTRRRMARGEPRRRAGDGESLPQRAGGALLLELDPQERESRGDGRVFRAPHVTAGRAPQPELRLRRGINRISTYPSLHGFR